MRLKMSDIARLAGVSVSTVSRALADSALITPQERARIQKIAHDAGYVINHAARNLRLQSTRTIGLVLPMGHSIHQTMTDPFLLELVGAITEQVVRQGYDLLISRDPDPKPDWLKDLVHSGRFDAIVVLGQSNQHDAINEVATSYAPLVVWGALMDGQIYTSVGTDNRLGCEMATAHLLQRGRRSLVYLGPYHLPEVASRYQGFLDAHTAHGIDPLPDHTRLCEFTPESALAAARGLLDGPEKPDGIVCASDVIALAVLDAAHEMGIEVPETLAVVGFDDVAQSRISHPPLSTVRQNIHSGAKHMIDILFQKMRGESARSCALSPELVVRGSS